MNRLPVIDRIISAFSQLESYLKLNSGQNLNTAAGLAEDFCIPLLKLVYGYELVSVAKTAAGIDLLDRTRRLAVQVKPARKSPPFTPNTDFHPGKCPSTTPKTR